MAISIHAVWLHLDEGGGGHGAVDGEEMKVRTSIIVDRGESGEDIHPFDENAHLMSEAGPPDNDENPNLIEDWNISVL